METGSRPRVLQVVGCAAPPVLQIEELLLAARSRGWDVHLALTPVAAEWLEDDLDRLTERTGHPVRSRAGRPGSGGRQEPADALLVAPATSNTVNKWAAGISDTLAIGLIGAALVRGSPVVVVPCVGERDRHPALARSFRLFRRAGAQVFLRPESITEPRSFTEAGPLFWLEGLAALDGVPSDRSPSHPGRRAAPVGVTATGIVRP